MIKKLKLKFILTNMLLLLIVLIFAFAFIYVQNAKMQEEKSISAMREIAESTPTPPDFMVPHNRNEGEHSHLPTYIIEVFDSTNQYRIEGFGNVGNLSKTETDLINEIIITVKNSNDNEGIIKDYNVRFYRAKTPMGIKIVLLDKQYEDDILKQLLISCLIIGVCALFGFLIISIIVAGIAIKPVEKSIKQQKQLISNISHDMKTPLTVISTNTDILLSHNTNIPSEELKWVKYIKDETHKMSEIIKMMLYLAKSDESDEKPKLSILNLSNIAYDVALPFESVCFESNKEFNIIIQPDVFIKANEYLLKQLFVILLDNAIKYSNENGRIVFNVKTINDNAIISVYNTGKPIPKKDIPFIFDRFYRADESRTRNEGGSGLGLSIAKNIIENNKGEISVSSDEEHGTTFSCTFSIASPK